jgi:hypothetical protein
VSREAAAALLVRHRDLLDSRPDVEVRELRDDVVALPGLERGWSPFLLALDDATLEHLEARGVDADWPAEAPASLLAFLDDVRATTTLPLLLDDAGTSPSSPRRHERPRKQLQIDAFARLVSRVAAKAARIVDVGSGHGHLTRALATAMGRPVIGLERDEGLAARARELAVDDARWSIAKRWPPHVAHDVAFAVTDVLRAGLELGPSDCVVGLHACGELGDLATTGVADVAGPAALVFVGCCLQKQRADRRRPLVGSDADLSLPKTMLGLSNLTLRDGGVEEKRVDNLAARMRRIALRLLLARDGVDVRPRAELEGLNRRAAHGSLPALVAQVYRARGLAMPSARQIDDAATDAQALHGRCRRLGLPRSVLARVLEVFVLLDRAAYLRQHRFDVDVGVVFAPEVSPRNLALVATRGC